MSCVYCQTKFLSKLLVNGITQSTVCDSPFQSERSRSVHKSLAKYTTFIGAVTMPFSSPALR